MSHLVEQPDSVYLTSAVQSSASKTAPFTALQLRQFAAYEKVRTSGAYNMFDPRARRATGLDPDDYAFVMNNYSALAVVSRAAA